MSLFNLDDVFESSSSCSSSSSSSFSSSSFLSSSALPPTLSSSSLFSSFLNDSTSGNNSANTTFRKGSTDFFSTNSDPLSYLSSFSSSSSSALDSSLVHSPPSLSASPSSPSHSSSDSELESWDFAETERTQSDSNPTNQSLSSAIVGNPQLTQNTIDLATSLATLLSSSSSPATATATTAASLSSSASGNSTDSSTGALLSLLVESLSNQSVSEEELKALLSSSLSSMNLNRYPNGGAFPSSSGSVVTASAGPLPTPLAFSKSVSNELNLQLLQQESPQSFMYSQRFLPVNRRAPLPHALPVGFLPNGYLTNALLAAPAYPVLPNYPYGANPYSLLASAPFTNAAPAVPVQSAMPVLPVAPPSINLLPSSSSSSSTSTSTASSTTVTPKTGDKEDGKVEDDDEEEKQLLQAANQNARALQQQSQTYAAAVAVAGTPAAYPTHLLHPALAHGGYHTAPSVLPSPAPTGITFSASLFPHEQISYSIGVPLSLNPSMMPLSVPMPSMPHAQQFAQQTQQDGKKKRRRKQEDGDSSDEQSDDDADDSDAPAKSARGSAARCASNDDETRKWITRTFFNSRVQREVEVVKRSRATGKATIVVESKKIKRREAARKCPRCEDFQAFIRHVIKTPSNRRGIDLTMVPHTCRQYDILLNSSSTTPTTPPSTAPSSMLPLPAACRVPISQEMVRPPQNGDVLCELDLRLPDPVGYRHFSFHALFHSASFMRRLNGSDQTKSRISYYAKFLTYCLSENEEYVVWFEDVDGKPTECSWSVEQEFVSMSEDTPHASSNSLEPAFHSVVAFNWTHERPKPLLKVARLPPHVSANAPTPVWFQQTSTAHGELRIVDVKLEKKKKFVQKKGVEGAKSHTPIMIKRRKGDKDKRREDEDSEVEEEEEEEEKEKKNKGRNGRQKNKKRKMVKAEAEEEDMEEEAEEEKAVQQQMKQEKEEDNGMKLMANGNGNGTLLITITKTEN